MRDFIFNQAGHGAVANVLTAAEYGPSSLRPWRDGGRFSRKNYITVNHKGKLRNIVTNAPALLRKDEWLAIDRAVMRVAKPELRLWGDLMSAGLSFNIPNALGTTIFQSQNMSDISGAVTSIDGRRRGEADRPVFDLTAIPLPIIHKDFEFSAREIAVSRRYGQSIDVTNAELAAEKVAEEVERYVAGTTAEPFSYGGATIYGYTTFPDRATKTMTTPTGSNNDTVIADILDMMKKSRDMYHRGPWMLYYSDTWSQFLDRDYSATKGNNTLRERILQIEGISGMRLADYLPPKTMILVEMKSSVVRGLVGMQIVTVQWNEEGGQVAKFKVMCILVPQLRSDQNGQTGIVHGTHA